MILLIVLISFVLQIIIGKNIYFYYFALVPSVISPVHGFLLLICFCTLMRYISCLI